MALYVKIMQNHEISNYRNHSENPLTDIYHFKDHRICFILSEPEYWEIILDGKPKEKELAAKNLRIASELRTQRAVLGNMPLEFTSSVGQKTRVVHDAGNRRLTLSQLPGKLRRREGEEQDTRSLA